MIPIINTSCEKGLANKTLDKNKFLELQIPVPPLEVQKSVVEKMDSLQRHMDNLEELKKVLVESMEFVMDCHLDND